MADSPDPGPGDDTCFACGFPLPRRPFVVRVMNDHFVAVCDGTCADRARHWATHRTCPRCERLDRRAFKPVDRFIRRSNGTYLPNCRRCLREIDLEWRFGVERKKG